MPDDIFVGTLFLGVTAAAELPSLLSELATLERACIFVVPLGQGWSPEQLEVLAPKGEWEIRTAEPGLLLSPSSVVFLPTDRPVRLAGQRLRFGSSREPFDPNSFLEGLAEARGFRLAAVLRGCGALTPQRGMTAVREHAGLVLNLDDAELASATLAQQLEIHAQRSAGDAFVGKETEIGMVTETLLAATGVDFSIFKSSTVRRRIARRMAARQTLELSDYVKLVALEPSEVQSLYSDLLVGVTELFRDPEVFKDLESIIFSTLIEQRQDDRPLRIWVPGCSRGDEAYSIAICGLEAMRRLGKSVRLQLFATDLNEHALTQARAGRYPDAVVEGLPDWARQHFIKLSQGYQVSKSVREICIFARQDVTKDPPFSRLDLISCRNLLIYLSFSSQRRTLQDFHYALRPGGYLLLGASEYLGDCESLFEPTLKKSKIFRRRMTAVSTPLHSSSLPSQTGLSSPQTEVPSSMDTPVPEHDIGKYADRLILGRFTPPGVVVDDSFNILSFRGRTGAFLEPPEGAATFNVLKMAREATCCLTLCASGSSVYSAACAV